MENSNETFTANMKLDKAWTVTSRAQSIDIDVTGLSEDILAHLVTHGLTQVIGDSAASAAKSAALNALGNDDFKIASKVKDWTTDEANWPAIQAEGLRMMEAKAAQLLEGTWTRIRSGGGGAGINPVTQKTRVLARPMYKATLGAEGVKAFNDFNNTAQYDAIDAYVAAMLESGFDIRAMAESMLNAIKDIKVDLGGL